jgi:hypothetical protein
MSKSLTGNAKFLAKGKFLAGACALACLAGSSTLIALSSPAGARSPSTGTYKSCAIQALAPEYHYKVIGGHSFTDGFRAIATLRCSQTTAVPYFDVYLMRDVSNGADSVTEYGGGSFGTAAAGATYTWVSDWAWCNRTGGDYYTHVLAGSNTQVESSDSYLYCDTSH